MKLIQTVQRLDYTYHILDIDKEIHMLDVDLIHLLKPLYPSIETIYELPISIDDSYILSYELSVEELAELNQLINGYKDKLKRVECLYSYTECLTLGEQVKDVRVKGLIESLLYPVTLAEHSEFEETEETNEVALTPTTENTKAFLLHHERGVFKVLISGGLYFVRLPELYKVLGYNRNQITLFVDSIKNYITIQKFPNYLFTHEPGHAYNRKQLVNAIELNDIKLIRKYKQTRPIDIYNWIKKQIPEAEEYEVKPEVAFNISDSDLDTKEILYYTDDIQLELIKPKDHPYYVFVDSLAKILNYSNPNELILINTNTCGFANGHSLNSWAISLNDIPKIMSYSNVQPYILHKWIKMHLSLTKNKPQENISIEYKTTSIGEVPLITLPGKEPVITPIQIEELFGITPFHISHHFKRCYTDPLYIIKFTPTQRYDISKKVKDDNSPFGYTYEGAIRRVGGSDKNHLVNIVNEIFSRNDYEQYLLDYNGNYLQVVRIEEDYFIAIKSLFGFSAYNAISTFRRDYRAILSKFKSYLFPRHVPRCRSKNHILAVNLDDLLKMKFKDVDSEVLYNWIKTQLKKSQSPLEVKDTEQEQTSPTTPNVLEFPKQEEPDKPENITSLCREIPTAFSLANGHSLTFIQFAKQIFTLYRSAYNEMWYTPTKGNTDFVEGLLGDFITVKGNEKQFIIQKLIEGNISHGLPMEDIPLITEEGINKLAKYNQKILDDYEAAKLGLAEQGDIYSVHWFNNN